MRLRFEATKDFEEKLQERGRGAWSKALYGQEAPLEGVACIHYEAYYTTTKVCMTQGLRCVAVRNYNFKV